MHALSYEDCCFFFQCLVFLVYLTISPNWQAWAKITQVTFEQIYYISSLHLRLLKSKMVIFISDDLVPPLQQMWWDVCNFQGVAMVVDWSVNNEWREPARKVPHPSRTRTVQRKFEFKVPEIFPKCCFIKGAS